MEGYQGIAVVDDPLFGISPVLYKSSHQCRYQADVVQGSVKGPIEVGILDSLWLDRPVGYGEIGDIAWRMAERIEKESDPSKRGMRFSLN